MKKVDIGVGDLTTAFSDIDAEIPFSDKLLSLSIEIAEELPEEASSLERAGRLATAILLQMGATGRLDRDKLFTFLKTLADKKTPDPVQRIEQRTELDMRVIIASVVKDNPDVLQRSIEGARKGRQEVMSRWNMDSSLSLPPTPTLETAESESSILPVEPNEIQDIRKVNNA